MAKQRNKMELPVINKQNKNWRIFLAFASAALTYFFLPDSCPEVARRMAVIFVLAALSWAFEIIPLFATSLLVILTETLLLVTPETLGINFTTFLAPLANPVIVLLLGGFILARAIQKYGIDHWLVSSLLKLFGTRPHLVMLGFMVTTAFLGMWISNTASTALMLGMIYPFLAKLDKHDLFRKTLVLAIPFGARIGGITTLVGTPTNAVAVGLLAEHGIRVNFLSWTLMTLPLALVLLFITSVILYKLFPSHHKHLVFSMERITVFNLQTKTAAGICLATVFCGLLPLGMECPSQSCLFFVSVL